MQRLLIATFFVLLVGCAGGGCASGCSCGGVTPLPGGYPIEERIENVAAVRVTDSGLAFLSENVGALASQFLPAEPGLPPGLVTFEIPESSGDILGFIGYTICPGGPDSNSVPPKCVAEIDIANSELSIVTTGPHAVVVSGAVKIRLQDLAVEALGLTIPVGVSGNGECGAGTPFADVDVELPISIEIEANAGSARFGYSVVRIGELQFVDEGAVDDAFNYCINSNLSFFNDVLDFIDGFLIGTILDGLTGSLIPTLEEQLCQPADPTLDPACPTGSFNVDGTCRVGPTADDDCVSVILGLEGNIDLAGLLASISPGTTGGFDFVLAAGGDSVRPDGSGHHYGDLNPINGGATVSFYGGARPTPLSGCVTPVDVERPTGIPVPEELNGNTVAGWPAELEGPHFGFALNERFTNYLLAQTYNSGALCIGITADALGDAVPLTTALIGTGLGAPSMSELGVQKTPQPLAIVLRPGAPPTVEFGGGTDVVNDPNITLSLPDVSFDFYVWSLDRYVRAFTTTLDVVAPVTLEVTPEGLTPTIPELSVANAIVTNSALLREDPATIAAALQDLLGSLVGSALGDALPPIDINGLTADLGIGLEIPPTVAGQGSPGITKLTSGSDDFLGIFATLSLTDPMTMMSERVETSITSVDVASFIHDEDSIREHGWTEDNQPSARLFLGSQLDDGTRAIEWQIRVDHGFWRPFTRDRRIDVTDPILRLEGKHTVAVRSRVAGQPHTLDPEPVIVELIVDSQPPTVSVSEQLEGEVAITATDQVSGPAGTLVRIRYLIEGDWTEWSAASPADQLQPLLPPLDATDVEVEATDEDGNVGVVQHALIRGRGDAAGGCACRIDAGPTPDEPLAWPLFALLGAVVLGRRRRRDGVAPRPRKNPLSTGKAMLAGSALVVLSGASGCSCGDDTAAGASLECRNSGTCTALEPGLVGAYTSAAVAPDGEVWVSGYLEANWDDDYSWGDLVVGRMVDGEVQWQVVDGLPADQLVDVTKYDPLGFRAGYTDPGPDVGLWTSLAVDGEGNPAVAYYDATNQALKYASLQGATWTTQTVQQVTGGSVGRYAELIFAGGSPTIAYHFIEPGEGDAIASGVRVATFNGSGWSFEDVIVNDNTPCRAQLCNSGTECVASTLECTATASDCGDCAAGQECVLLEGSAQCADVLGSSQLVTYPDETGLYVSAALQPDNTLGLAFYDRVRGNLWTARKVDGAWAPLLVDGEMADGTDTGDKGVGTDLFIDQNGNWHVTYVDGLSEALNYINLEGGETIGPAEVVDDGLYAGDGVHVVGDDSSVFVSPGGEVRVAYQDATAGSLRYAVGTPSADGHDWTATTLPQDEFAGAFSQILEVDGGLGVVNWWRVASPAAQGNVRMVTP